MNKKKESRLRRARRGRKHIGELKTPRLTVFRSPRHMYAQIFSDRGETVEVSASTLEKELKSKDTGNVSGAKAVGKLLAERAKKAGIVKVAFDRSGYKYHGRVKALADAARESGLQF